MNLMMQQAIVQAARNRGGGGAPITFAALATLEATNNSTTYSTPSYTPTSNALVLAIVEVFGTSIPEPTYAGNGLTWVAVASSLTPIGNCRITIFRAMGSSPSSGAGTVTVGATSSNCTVRVVEFAGVKTTGANGADAVVQSGVNSGTSATASVTLAALASASNAVFAAAVNATLPYGGTPETDWTEDYDGGSGSPVTGLHTMYRIGTTDNTPTVTGPNQGWAMAALEICPP